MPIPLAEFAKNIAKTGIDGFYVSLQGGEYKRYSEDFFTTWFKPLDIMLLNALKATGKKVLLHICGTGMRLDCYHDYPGDIVNMACVDNNIPIQQILRDFDRAVMGGIPNHGVIVEGTKEQVQAQVRAALSMDTRGVCLVQTAPFPRTYPPSACVGRLMSRTPWERMKKHDDPLAIRRQHHKADPYH